MPFQPRSYEGPSHPLKRKSGNDKYVTHVPKLQVLPLDCQHLQSTQGDRVLAQLPLFHC